MNHLVEQVKQHVFEVFQLKPSDHDHLHIERVLKMAEFLQSKEGGNLEVIQLAALLHDISDHKLNGGKLNDGARASRIVLEGFGAQEPLIQDVCEIIDQVSFKGAYVEETMESLEGKIVQDADRLDAIGAIGIARAFAFGGSRNRPIYSLQDKPELHSTFEAYVAAEGNTINHFYEKLLLLKDRLHTETAKEIGKKRHQFMIDFLDHFTQECISQNYE